MTIFNNTQIRLSAWDAIKTLLGRTIRINTEIVVDADVMVVETRQLVDVDPLVYSDKPDLLQPNSYAVFSTDRQPPTIKPAN